MAVCGSQSIIPRHTSAQTVMIAKNAIHMMAFTYQGITASLVFRWREISLADQPVAEGDRGGFLESQLWHLRETPSVQSFRFIIP